MFLVWVKIQFEFVGNCKNYWIKSWQDNKLDVMKFVVFVVYFFGYFIEDIVMVVVKMLDVGIQGLMVGMVFCVLFLYFMNLVGQLVKVMKKYGIEVKDVYGNLKLILEFVGYILK